MVRRRRGSRIVRRARRLFRPGRIGHTRKGVPEMLGDSYLGIRLMKALAKLRADRNIARVKSADGEPGKGPGVLNHWPLPGRHGMHSLVVSSGENVRNMTLEEFKSLHGPLGIGTHTVHEDNTALAAGRRKLHPIWEPKSEDCNELAFWQDAVRDAESKGLVPWGWALPAYHHILPVMKQAGVKRVIKLKGH